MKRSPIWIAAYVRAWDRWRTTPVWEPDGRGRPPSDVDTARRAAAEADECEAGYVAAFGREGL